MIRRLEDVLSESLGYAVDPYRQREQPDPVDPERRQPHRPQGETEDGTVTDPGAAIRRL